MRRHALLLALTIVAGCSTDSRHADNSATAPSFNATDDGGVPIPGRYIVTLRGSTDPGTVASEHGVTAEYFYHTALRGFAGAINEAAHQALLRDARVLRVEPDRIVQAHIVPVTQPNPPWGLDRTDQRALPLNAAYVYDNTASSVNAYIIDTGIRLAHVEFGGRASFGFDALGGNGDDCDGHGTHVAGTVGGSTYGIAKQVRLVAVRVLNCSGSGTTSGVIAGVNWVTANHVKPAVANMSLGGSASVALDDAVRAMINAGVATAVSAGNSGTDACTASPARVIEAMTVGATGSNDFRASFSNFGSCVEIFAPGVGILSAYANSNTSTASLSGTSMSSPHVAGVAALYLQNNPTAAATQVHQAIYDLATKGIVQNAATARNDLLYSRVDGGAPPPPNQAPAVTWVTPVDGATISGNAAMRITASDDADAVGALTVQFTFNGGLQWHRATYSAASGMYEANFPTTALTDGSYTLQARATDSRAAVGTAPIQVQVVNNAPPPPPPPPPPPVAAPSVTWINPTDGAVISGSVPLRIQATSTVDAAGSLQVSWRFNSVWHRATYNAASGYYESNWPTAAFANGSYVMEARAIDSGGRTTLLTINVQLSN